jgi:asparagine synthase (glutamine-hydrolysing)
MYDSNWGRAYSTVRKAKVTYKMCGLVTIFAYSADALPVNRNEVIAIRDRMFNRGPDGCGSWFSQDGHVGLGHRRLSIIDTSSDGLQPMASFDGMIQVVFNGEIYNYLELREQLSAYGHVFHSHSDTEVLLAGWREWGESLVDHLRGMFAFAIWDNSKQGLFVARDHFGIKPLYIADDGKTLRIASQVKALLAGGQIDTTPDAAGHVGYFLWGSVPEPHTFYRDIKAIEPGCSLWIEKGKAIRKRQFADVEMMLLLAEEKSRSWSVDEVQERLKAAVYDSVSKHLISDVPIGIFLSSGIDSCALAAVASEVSQRQINTLTLGFEQFRGMSQDETALAEVMARQLSSRHETRWVRKQDFDGVLEEYFDAMDQPTQDGVNTWLVCKAAKEAGIKVALSGLGGDELLGGYPSFEQIPRLVNRLRYAKTMSPTLGPFARKLLSPLLSNFTSSKYAGLLEYGTNFPGAYLLRRSLFMPWELSQCLPHELVQDGLPQLIEEIQALEPSSKLKAKGRVSVLETSLYMRNQLLRDSDWTSMAHSIELRVPLVDLEVLAAASLANKQSLAFLPNTPLPKSITNRPKTGFSTPVRDWADQTLSTGMERGLRGWSKYVYKRYTESTKIL